MSAEDPPTALSSVVMHPHPVLHLTVEPGNEVPRLARTFVRQCVTVLGSAATDDAILLTSELVTNAVKHTSSDTVEITLERFGDNVRIGVADDEATTMPVALPPDPLRVGGFGVRLVADLAQDWGVEQVHGDGKRVWFDIDLPAISASPPPD